MEVEIITPDKNIFKGEAKFVSVPGIDGSLGILEQPRTFDHYPYCWHYDLAKEEQQ